MEPRNWNPNDAPDACGADPLAALGPDTEWEPNLDRGLALLHEGSGKVRGRARRWTWIMAASAATCVSVMATPVTRAFAQRCISACVDETAWVRQFLRAAPSASFVKPAGRRMAPDFTLNDISGMPVKLSEFRGKVVLLNFWATWCGPCKVEIPMLMGLEEAYRNRDFVVLGVALDEDGWNAIKPYAEARRISYRVMAGNDQISSLFGGLDAVPTTFIIDRNGRIAATHVGLCQKSEYESDIKTVLNE